MWKRLAGRPGGSRLFSVAAMARVPYFASVLPHVMRMEPGFAEVTIPKWFFVKKVEFAPRNAPWKAGA
jgi:predicted component of type VI protein secretion system